MTRWLAGTNLSHPTSLWTGLSCGSRPTPSFWASLVWLGRWIHCGAAKRVFTLPSADAPARKADPCVMVIFGASGDLTKRKLIPALLNLAAAKLLPEQFAIIGYASNDFTTETFRTQLTEEIKNSPVARSRRRCGMVPQRHLLCARRFPGPRGVQNLKRANRRGGKNPQCAGEPFLLPGGRAPLFWRSGAATGRGRLAQEAKAAWARVIIEKPFGRDLDSAAILNREIKQILEERRFIALIITSARRRCRTS
jgi:glucose-6-phosphate 1-dehydrogenase